MDEAAGSEYSFEKSYTREIAPGEPAVIQVRENESLVVATVEGCGRLLVNAYEAASSELIVLGAVVFDSDAFFFHRGGPIAVAHH